MTPSTETRGALYGIVAAGLFGMSAPLAKSLVSGCGPIALAGVFYLSAGCVLTVADRIRRPRAEAPLKSGDLPLLIVVTLTGGVIAPVLMLFGLSQVSGVAGALLLNLEAPFTMLVAVRLFGEHLGRGEGLAASGIVAGGVLLAVASSGDGENSLGGILAIAGACLSWAFDNNLTQRLSLRDPVAIVRLKALGAGAANLLLALALGDYFPVGGALLAAATVGALSYGLSIVLDTYALRFVGAAREAAYFATAPFFGALLAVPLLGERFGPSELGAGVAMGLGAAFLLRARHSHVHHHPALEHEHAHVHDEHHQHAHGADVPNTDAHSHRHTHAPLNHAHPHVSDAHHRHRH